MHNISTAKTFKHRLCLFIFLCNTTLLFGYSDTTYYSMGVVSDVSRLDSMQQIEEVYVTGHTQKEVISSQKLDGKRLEGLNSFSVADAIRYFSGVQIKDYGGVGGIKTVDIRSMGTNQMGVFYDGIQLGNAQNGQVDLGKFSLDNIESISLYNGQKSEIFQSAKDYGSAGTIYIRTRKPKFADGKKFNIQLTMKGGSFGLANPSFLWEQKISENISSSLNAEYTYATGRYKFRYRKVLHDGTIAWDTTAVRENGDVNALRIEGGFFGYIPQGKWHLKAYFYDSERGIPGAIVNNVWTNSQRQWDRNAFVQGSYQQELFKGYEFMFNAKYANDYMRYLNPDTTLMYIDNSFVQQEIYLSVANKYSIFKEWDVSLSADYQWNILDADLRDFVYPKRNTLLVAAATAFDIWNIKGQASVLGTFVFENVTRKSLQDGENIIAGQEAKPDNTYAVTPAAFLSYSPFDGFDIHAFYKRIFRMPTFNDLYYTDIGNISLKPEYTTQYDIGIQYVKEFKKSYFRKLALKADGYFNQVENKIIAVPKGNGQYRWMMMNLGYVEITGVDVSSDILMVFPYDIQLGLHINYTYQEAKDLTDPTDNDPVSGTYGGQIAYIPWHSGSVTGNLSYQTWGLNYSFIYVGERYHNSSNILANHEQPWYTHDLALSKEFQFKKWKLKLSAEVNNVFDQQYDVILNYPMPGRNYKGIIKCTF